jgi:hypothetical protein
MDEARGEEATQSAQQQACILSGGVYLRHRTEKADVLEGYVSRVCFLTILLHGSIQHINHKKL